MKKVLALLLALILIVALCACGAAETGNTKKNESKPSTTVKTDVDDDDDDDEPKEPLVLDGTDEYVVVAKRDSGLTLSKIEDIKGEKVGVIKDCDSQKIGEYYGAEVRIQGTEHDVFSSLTGGETKFGIARKSACDTDRVEIVLDPIVIQ